MARDGVGRDTEHDGTYRREILELVADGARLYRATGRIVLRVEIEQDPLPSIVGKRMFLPVLIWQSEGGGLDTNFRHIHVSDYSIASSSSWPRANRKNIASKAPAAKDASSTTNRTPSIGTRATIERTNVPSTPSDHPTHSRCRKRRTNRPPTRTPAYTRARRTSRT